MILIVRLSVVLSLLGVANANAANFFQQLLPRTSGTTRDLWSVAASPNGLVAVGAQGTILTSGDGIQWVQQVSGVTNDLFSVAASENRIVAVGAGGTIISSSDGHTWSVLSASGGNDLLGVTVSSGGIAVVGTKGTLLFSADGATFQSRSLLTSASFHAVDSGFTTDGTNPPKLLYAAVGDEGLLVTSEDGDVWTPRETGSFDNFYDVEVGPRVTHLVGGGRTYGLYANGVVTLTAVAPTDDLISVRSAIDPFSGDELYEAALDRRGGIWRGHMVPDALREPLSLFTRSSFASLNDLTIFHGAIFAVGRSGAIVSTPVWFERQNPSGEGINSLAYGQGEFVALAGTNTVLISTNGQSWSNHAISPPSTNQPGPFSAAVLYANGTFLAARGNLHFPPYDLLYSTNALDWKKVSGFGSDQYVTGIGYGDKEFVASSYSSIYRGSDTYQDTDYIQQSPNGQSWNGEATTFRFTELERFNGKSFALSPDNQIYISANSVNWSPIPANGTNLDLVDNVLFNGNSYTADGTTWQNVQFFPQSWGSNFSLGKLAGRKGTYVVASAGGVPGVGTLIGDGRSATNAHWAAEFNLPASAAVSGLVFAQNTFVVATSDGSIYQSEAMPTTLSIEPDGSGNVVISTTADNSLALQSTDSLSTPQWIPAGSVDVNTSITVRAGSRGNRFFRVAPTQ